MRGRGRRRLDAVAKGVSGPPSLDPRAILTSIGETVYTWDIATDAITWGVNAAEVLGLEDVSALASGRAFALAAEPGSGLTRHEAVWGAKDRDKGGGVPYRARCAIRCRPNRVCIIEDTGRWFADAEGRAVFAHGVVRIIGQDEEALDRAKRASKRSFVFNVPAYERQQTPCQAHAAAAFDVIEALNAHRVVFARQPVVDARSRDLAFSEALVRIRTGDGRLVSAGDILPAVERAGLVPLVDARVLELTADYLAANPEERLSVNVSPLTIEGTDWLTTLAAHVGARPGIASRLIIEVTETAAIRDPEATRARLDAMKALGVAIAIDDFGAGHSSFELLCSLPVDILKIDGAFVQNLARSGDDRFFVRTLIDLAHHLGLTIVAEWVEDEETARMLADWGVDYLQGEHCGMPAVVEPGAESRPWSRVA